MSKINILYYSCPYDLSGYGSVSRNHLLNLKDREELKIRLKVKKFWTGVAPDLGGAKEILQSMERTPISNEDFIFIEHLTPENFYIDPRAKYHIAYAPFETDGAPIPWLLPFRGMDEIWVPSSNNRNAYIKVGLNPSKIRVIPHGVDTDKFNPGIDPLSYNRGKFNLGSVFDWTERKNPTALIRAYYNAFTGGEDVTLTIKTFWRFPISKSREYISSEIDNIKKEYKNRTSFPKILLWLDTLDEKLMPNFFKSMDCFVLPTRGEGFGLPFLEAMACGVPTIGPIWGGNTDFMNSKNSLLIKGKIVPIDHHKFLQMQPQYSGQRWFDIDEVELSAAIKWIYENRDKAKLIADVALKEVRKNWTWKITAEKIWSRIKEINSGEGVDRFVMDDMDFMGGADA